MLRTVRTIIPRGRRGRVVLIGLEGMLRTVRTIIPRGRRGRVVPIGLEGMLRTVRTIIPRGRRATGSTDRARGDVEDCLDHYPERTER